MSEEQACAVPLIELLRGVPPDARLVIEETPYSTRFIPVGRYCKEAADALSAPAPGEPAAITASTIDNLLREIPGADWASWGKADAFAAGYAAGVRAAAPHPVAPLGAVVGIVDGDEMSRRILWSDNIAAFDYPVGTKLYAAVETAPTQQQIDAAYDQIAAVFDEDDATHPEPAPVAGEVEDETNYRQLFEATKLGHEQAFASSQKAHSALSALQRDLNIMMASAVAEGGEWVEGYRIKTGALHRIFGTMQEAGYSVVVPSVSAEAPAITEVRTDPKQPWTREHLRNYPDEAMRWLNGGQSVEGNEPVTSGVLPLPPATLFEDAGMVGFTADQMHTYAARCMLHALTPATPSPAKSTGENA